MPAPPWATSSSPHCRASRRWPVDGVHAGLGESARRSRRPEASPRPPPSHTCSRRSLGIFQRPRPGPAAPPCHRGSPLVRPGDPRRDRVPRPEPRRRSGRAVPDLPDRRDRPPSPAAAVARRGRPDRVVRADRPRAVRPRRDGPPRRGDQRRGPRRAELVDRIQRRADGNAFFVEELLMAGGGGIAVGAPAADGPGDAHRPRRGRPGKRPVRAPGRVGVRAPCRRGAPRRVAGHGPRRAEPGAAGGDRRHLLVPDPDASGLRLPPRARPGGGLRRRAAGRAPLAPPGVRGGARDPRRPSPTRPARPTRPAGRSSPITGRAARDDVRAAAGVAPRRRGGERGVRLRGAPSATTNASSSSGTASRTRRHARHRSRRAPRSGGAGGRGRRRLPADGRPPPRGDHDRAPRPTRSAARCSSRSWAGRCGSYGDTETALPELRRRDGDAAHRPRDRRSGHGSSPAWARSSCSSTDSRSRSSYCDEAVGRPRGRRPAGRGPRPELPRPRARPARAAVAMRCSRSAARWRCRSSSSRPTTSARAS